MQLHQILKIPCYLPVLREFVHTLVRDVVGTAELAYSRTPTPGGLCPPYLIRNWHEEYENRLKRPSNRFSYPGYKEDDATASDFKKSLLSSLFSVRNRALARPTGHETFTTRAGDTKR